MSFMISVLHIFRCVPFSIASDSNRRDRQSNDFNAADSVNARGDLNGENR